MQSVLPRIARAFGKTRRPERNRNSAGIGRNDVAGFEDRKIRTKTAKMGRICRYLAEQTLIRHDPCE
jgi:hypothetical protein